MSPCLADAALSPDAPIEQIRFGNCGVGTFDQRNIRGGLGLQLRQEVDHAGRHETGSAK